jgi:hypothetical protein
MVYVLLNFRKHLRAPACIDPRSSGPHFPGWRATPAATDVEPATAEPSTWMARVGWRRAGGPLRVDEHPAVAPRPPNLNWRMLQRAEAPRLTSAGVHPVRNAERSARRDE